MFAWLLLITAVLAAPAATPAQVAVGISARIGPPPLPIYAQPMCPGPGFIWVPGYWAYGPMGYYWVPGTWVMAPRVDYLWTPGYWGWGNGFYIWHPGYWGPHVGFYGGINYGFGYGGGGYAGGRWRNGVFMYNRAVTNVNTTIIHNTYIDRTVVNNVNVNRVSYNGGEGGTTARPSPGQEAAAREAHMHPTAAQARHERMASTRRGQFASQNQGRPDFGATSRPGTWNRGPARPNYNRQENRRGANQQQRRNNENPPRDNRGERRQPDQFR